jgi:hypothetical protein
VLRGLSSILSSLLAGAVMVGGCLRARSAAPPSPSAEDRASALDAAPPASASAGESPTSAPSSLARSSSDADAANNAASAPEPALDPSVAAAPTSPLRRELPRGGFEIFPQHRLVGFCGTPSAPKLGRLAGNLSARAKTIESYASQYEGDRKALPVFELIAVVVQESPG